MCDLVILEIEQILGEVMALTKINFDSASFPNVPPTTLRFANQVGEM